MFDQDNRIINFIKFKRDTPLCLEMSKRQIKLKRYEEWDSISKPVIVSFPQNIPPKCFFTELNEKVYQFFFESTYWKKIKFIEFWTRLSISWIECFLHVWTNHSRFYDNNWKCLRLGLIAWPSVSFDTTF